MPKKQKANSKIDKPGKLTTRRAAKKAAKQPHPDAAKRQVKLSFKKHILPPLAGIGMMLLVFGFFNASWLSSRIAYWLQQRQGTTEVAHVAPATKPQPLPKPDPSAPSSIEIPKINVKAPVHFDKKIVNEGQFQLALRTGVVHYPATAVPGKPGNVVIFGHSSGMWWAPGKYKFVFTLLDKMEKGDQVTLHYQGIRFVYNVSDKYVVDPDNMSVLKQPKKAHMLTLITCTPVGTSNQRLIVEAEQIIPKPIDTTVKETDAKPAEASNAKLPGAAPSFWDSFTALFH